LQRATEQKLRRLRILSRRLDRMIENGSFYALPFWQRFALVRRVKRLYSSLLGPLSPGVARAIVAGAATLAIAACVPAGENFRPLRQANSPSFVAPVKDPFGFVPIAAGKPVAPAFADIDGNGTADLFAGAGGEGAGVIAYFKNTGSQTAPSFAAGAPYPGLPDDSTVFADRNPVPVLAPLHGGSVFDALVGSGVGGAPYLQYFQNSGSTFSPTALPAGLPSNGDYELDATAVDINGDGLLDVLVSSTSYDSNTAAFVNTIDYYKNTGTATAPAFTDQATSLGIDLPAGSFGYPTFVDINGDGLYDAFVGNDNGDIYYFKNIGTATAPKFAAPVKNPFGITAVPAGPAVPAFVDIDHDGDFDLFVGDGNGDLWFYKNTNF